mmetsp:Transcript_23524/g.49791  ORF Transcript_23524/g.49791 Transcript_23524/m.49791 type:complete len:204 (-) Transcript_23524:1316-1927(-)
MPWLHPRTTACITETATTVIVNNNKQRRRRRRQLPNLLPSQHQLPKNQILFLFQTNPVVVPTRPPRSNPLTQPIRNRKTTTTNKKQKKTSLFVPFVPKARTKTKTMHRCCWQIRTPSSLLRFWGKKPAKSWQRPHPWAKSRRAGNAIPCGSLRPRCVPVVRPRYRHQHRHRYRHRHRGQRNLPPTRRRTPRPTRQRGLLPIQR